MQSVGVRLIAPSSHPAEHRRAQDFGNAPSLGGAAGRAMGRVAVKDLRDLSRDKNVPDAVRSTSLRLYRIKQK
jgi:hypothetical protein